MEGPKTSGGRKMADFENRVEGKKKIDMLVEKSGEDLDKYAELLLEDFE